MDDKIMYKRIYEVYNKCNITSLPINCFKILDAYNIKYKTFSAANEKQKCHNATSDAFTLKKTVFYNETVFERRTAFNIMHEFGHYIMEIPDGTDKDEDNADYFASCFMAPRILIHHLTKKQNADEIHDIFGLSYAASNIAVMDYKKWISDIQTKPQRRPSDAEEKLYDIFKAKKDSNQLESKPIPKVIPKQEVSYSDITNEQCKRWIAYLHKERKKRDKDRIEIEKRIQILQNYGYNFYQSGENDKLYGFDLK